MSVNPLTSKRPRRKRLSGWLQIDGGPEGEAGMKELLSSKDKVDPKRSPPGATATRCPCCGYTYSTHKPGCNRTLDVPNFDHGGPSRIYRGDDDE